MGEVVLDKQCGCLLFVLYNSHFCEHVSVLYFKMHPFLFFSLFVIKRTFLSLSSLVLPASERLSSPPLWMFPRGIPLQLHLGKRTPGDRRRH